MSTKKEAVRVGSSLFNVKWEVLPVKLAALLKRKLIYETFSTKFLRSHSFEVLWVVSFERLYKESNDICRCQQDICSKKSTILRKTPVLESLFNAVTDLRPELNLKDDSSWGVFWWIDRNFKNTFFTGHLLIGKLQAKDTYRSPVPVTLKEMPCDFIKVGLYKEHFQKNIATLFRYR